MDTVGGATVEHVEVCVAGRRRSIAMRSSDWVSLHRAISLGAYARLLVALRRFCDGCDTLPEQAFRRVADDPHGRLEEFVADGVRVIGRRGNDNVQQTFFVTRVAIGAPAAAEPNPPRQAMLPLDIGCLGGT